MISEFNDLADYIQTQLQGSEIYTAWFEGEESTFCRFNHAKVRQVGDVTLNQLAIRLIDGQRTVAKRITLTGLTSEDRERVKAVVVELRHQIPMVPEDPYLLYATTVNSSVVETEASAISASEIVDHILSSCQGDDLVGILASGPTFRGFANSFGQRNWHSSNSFHFDYSLYYAADKAVKGGYAGFQFEKKRFDERITQDREQLAILQQPVKELKPGQYRSYLAPAALTEITDMLCWGGFGKKSQMTKRTPLIQMVEEGKTLSSQITLQEATTESGAPGFNADGYIKASHVDLISAGRCIDPLISARSAKEYGVETNGANSNEAPESLSLAAGTLLADDVLPELGEGIYINNTWYLNFSDRQSCRMTGMTRFAAFWVEQGKIVAPLNVMRFDDTIYRMLGENLVGLTETRDFMPSASTYGGRSTDSTYLPGALIKDFSLTL